MVTRVPRRVRMPSPAGVTTEIQETAAKWYRNYRLAKEIKVQQEGSQKEPGYRPWLLTQIVKTGRTITGGHKVVLFDPPVEGLHGLKAQRAAGPEFQELVAAGLLTKKSADVQAACKTTRWAFRSDKVGTIVQALEDAGVLEECVEDGYPKTEIDPDAITRVYQLHKEPREGETERDIITEAEMDLMLPDKVTWSIHPITEPWREISDVD